jgi:hypothetical protein
MYDTWISGGDVNSLCCYGLVYLLDSWQCLRSLLEVHLHIHLRTETATSPPKAAPPAYLYTAMDVSKADPPVFRVYCPATVVVKVYQRVALAAPGSPVWVVAPTVEPPTPTPSCSGAALAT